MSSIKVKNTSDSDVTVNYIGRQYTIGANEIKSFPSDVAKHWVTVYQFMTLEGEGDELVEIEASIVEELPNEEKVVEEEVKEEVKKVKKSTPKKK